MCSTMGGRATRSIFVALLVVLAACATDDLDRGGAGSDPDELFDPTEIGEPLPVGYRESLPRDAINPVYEPVMVEVGGVDWPDDEMVIGVDFDGEARAYPVGFLTWHEIVNDWHRGIPTLVTW